MKLLFAHFFLLFVTFSQAQKTQKPLPESAQIKNAITSFFNWYCANWKKVNAFKLYKGKHKEDAPPYIIDWKETERYFLFPRKNAPQPGEAVFKNEKSRFKVSQEVFEKYSGDEIASVFDYDRLTNSQEEPELFWEKLSSSDAN